VCPNRAIKHTAPQAHTLKQKPTWQWPRQTQIMPMAPATHSNERDGTHIRPRHVAAPQLQEVVCCPTASTDSKDRLPHCLPIVLTQGCLWTRGPDKERDDRSLLNTFASHTRQGIAWTCEHQTHALGVLKPNCMCQNTHMAGPQGAAKTYKHLSRHGPKTVWPLLQPQQQQGPRVTKSCNTTDKRAPVLSGSRDQRYESSGGVVRTKPCH